MLEIDLRLLEGSLLWYGIVSIFLYFLSAIKKVQYTQFITRNKFLKLWVVCIILAVMQIVCVIGMEIVKADENMSGELYAILVVSIFVFTISSRVLFLSIMIKRAVGFTYKKTILFFFCTLLLLNEILNIVLFLFVVIFSVLWLLIPIHIPKETGSV